MKVALTAKTHKGKNKLREAGTDEWFIRREVESVQCLGGKAGLLIEPSFGFVDGKSRWVLRQDDPDFSFEIPRSDSGRN